MVDQNVIAPLLPIFNWVWDKYGKEIVDKASKAAWNRVEWKIAARRYSEKANRLYNTMRILGRPGSVPLKDIFTDVYILEIPAALRRYSIEHLEYFYSKQPTWHREGERLPGLKLVQKHPKLFVLGGPGAGKTTFLKYLALQAVEGKIDKVPIFITLRTLADTEQTGCHFSD